MNDSDNESDSEYKLLFDKEEKTMFEFVEEMEKIQQEYFKHKIDNDFKESLSYSRKVYRNMLISLLRDII